MKIVRLRERDRIPVADSGLSRDEIRQIRRAKPGLISVAQDSDDRDVLLTGGWIGHLPVSQDLELILEPKVRLANLFGMMELVTGLKLDDTTRDSLEAGDIQEVFSRLARHLSMRIIRRSHQGLYKQYVPITEGLNHIRGRFNTLRLAAQPHKLDLECNYDNHTEDIEDNRILLSALRRMSTMPFRPEVLDVIRRAHSELRGRIEQKDCSPQICLNRRYNRLNEPYRILHQLAWFFLANAGPTFCSGDRRITSFLLNVDKLFEDFVASWIKDRLEREGLRVSPQLPFHIEHMDFRIDILIRDRDGYPLAVLDTKYKDEVEPSHADINQVVTYAHSNNCTEAVLVYPSPVRRPLLGTQTFGTVRVRSLVFDLASCDLGKAGDLFLRSLGIRTTPCPILSGPME